MAYGGVPALTVPADFWRLQTVDRALRARDFAALFLLLKRHIKASQTQIAVACDLTQSQVSQVMNGHQPRSHEVFQRIAAGLDMPDHARMTLGLAPLQASGTSQSPKVEPASHAPAMRPRDHDEPRTVLAHLIRQRNQTYTEAAAQIGMSPRHLARLARQERRIDSEDLQPATRRALQNTFGRPAEQLLLPWSDHAGSATTPGNSIGIPGIRDRSPSVAPDPALYSEHIAPSSNTTAGRELSGSLSTYSDGRGSAWQPQDTIEIARHLTQGDLQLDRREAVRTLAGLTIGGALLERLEPWLIGSKTSDPSARPYGIGNEEVEQVENAARLFRAWGHQFGGSLRRKAVIGLLSSVAEELHHYSHPPSYKRRLFGVMGKLASTAASMSWDSGLGSIAQQYYIIELRGAKASGDRAFGANVLAGMARQLLYLGRPTEALELIRLAQDGSRGHAPPTVVAMLHTREAWAYARQGRVTAFRRATDKAQDALIESRHEDNPYWIAYFDQAELEGVTGGRLLELAHEAPHFAGEAADRIERAITLRRPKNLRSAALDQIGLAESRLVQGHAEEASRLAHEAADVVTMTQSDRVRVKLAELYRYTDGHAANPAVANLRIRIRELLVDQPNDYREESLA